jgi:hypothetical protein
MHRAGACPQDATLEKRRAWRRFNERAVVTSRLQNIPSGLARGTFGASHGAESFESPTTCKVFQCSIALPSASIL